MTFKCRSCVFWIVHNEINVIICPSNWRYHHWRHNYTWYSCCFSFCKPWCINRNTNIWAWNNFIYNLYFYTLFCHLSLLDTDLNTFYIDIYYQFSLLKFDGPIYLYRVYFRFYGKVRVAHRFSFLCCPIMCRYVLSSVLWCPLRIPHKNDVRFVFTYSCL
jgi:hypothetical protein